LVTPAETPLTGGTLNPVVRIGDTVRRPVGPWTPTIHSLLAHIHRRGFHSAPEAIGVDDEGREILTYVPGTTVGWSMPWPPIIRSDDLLAQVGQTLADYHRAVADFRPPGEVPWQLGAAAIADNEIVCHHDVAPYNTVIDGDRLVAIIDWDLAGPAPARSDLAFAAWQWVPLHGPTVSAFMGWDAPPARARRLRLLLDAYALQDRAGFVNAVIERVRFNRSTMLRRAAEGSAAYQALVDQGHIAGMDEALGYLIAHGPALQESL
jgi:hypothetical protein